MVCKPDGDEREKHPFPWLAASGDRACRLQSAGTWTPGLMLDSGPASQVQPLGTRGGNESHCGHTVRGGAEAGLGHCPGLPDTLCNQGRVSGTLARNLGWTGGGGTLIPCPTGDFESHSQVGDLKQVSAFRSLVSSREGWGKSDSPRGVSVGIKTGNVWKGRGMRPGTKQALSKWKQACSCPLSPLHHVGWKL